MYLYKMNDTIVGAMAVTMYQGKDYHAIEWAKQVEDNEAAVIHIIASPVYFYGLSAQVKAVIDRCHNPIRDTFNIKKTALLLVGASTLPELFDSIITQNRLSLNFFHLEDAGCVVAREVKDKGDIKNTKAFNEAYELGRLV